MAGATNTIIQILRSDVTAYPATLNPGEQAYSFVSNKLFVGNNTNSVVTIGGKYYVDLIDGATSASTGNTLVRRTTTGNSSFNKVTIDAYPSVSTDAATVQYVTDSIDAFSTDTIYSGTVGQIGYSNVHTLSGQVIVVANNKTTARFTDAVANFYNTDVTISGNLTVSGTTSYTNVQTLYVEDNDIVLNANTSGAPSIDAYITVNRGSADNAALVWSESAAHWQVDNAVGTKYSIVDVGGGQSISGTTTLNAASVTNGIHAGSLEVSGHSNVSSLTANSTIRTNQLIVTSNVQLANVANVSYYAAIQDAAGNGTAKHYLMLSDSNSGNTKFQSNTLVAFDTANTTLAIGYSSYTPLPNTLYQATGSSYEYVQNNIQNLNNEGSSDWVATADNGTDSTGFIDMGMAGGNHISGDNIYPNDGYLLVTGQTGIGSSNLHILTAVANNDATVIGDIIFGIGDSDNANIAGYITRQNQSPTGALTWALGTNKFGNANTAYTLDVAGSANVSAVYINNTKILGESFALPTTFGGTGRTSVTANAILYGTGTGALGVTNAPSAGQVLQYRTDGVMFAGLDGGVF